MVTKYIYEDTYYDADYTAYEGFNYAIKDGNKTIYRGRAYGSPDTGQVKIKINTICEDYLSNELPDDWYSNISADVPSGAFSNINGYKVFDLYVINEDGETKLESYGFRYCWSYDETVPPSVENTLSEVINGHYSINEIMLASIFYDPIAKVYNYYSLGLPEQVPGLPYTKEACGHGALYYLNRRGGWDSFLIEGNIKRTDEIESFDITGNATYGTQQFAKRRYLSNTKRKWALNTSWLSDAESERLANNLISSLSVYFHDFATDEVIPVLITDTSVEHKRFINKRKLNQYQINIEASQIKIRK